MVERADSSHDAYCAGFFLMLGTIGWRASLAFVRHIYKVCTAFPRVITAHCKQVLFASLSCTGMHAVST